MPDPDLARPVLAADRAGREMSLPLPLTGFVGRESEVAVVVALLRRDDVPLVTLTGPGGVGKTRLALKVAEVVASDHAGGVVFIDISPLRDPGLVLPTIARTLGLGEVTDRPGVARLADSLATRDLLLVLDTLEQVVEAAPDLADLLRACPNQKILTTSRVPLRITGEHVVPVAPLPVPDLGNKIAVSEVASVAAVDLFTRRARAVDPAFTLTEANAPTVAAIVRQVDGLPLAIELAAARTRQLPLAALLAGLAERLRLLTSGPRDAPARHRTHRDTIAWSHDLLAPAEQTLFRRLAVCLGGCTPMAAAAIGGMDARDVLDGLLTLLDHGLLRRLDAPDAAHGNGAQPRFGMLDTVREFALERLVASGEETEIRTRHAAHVAAFAAATGGVLQPVSKDALARLAAEHDNARAALTWTIARGDAKTGLGIAAGFYRLWHIRGHLAEGRHWSREVLALDGAAPPALRAAVWFEAGWLAGLQGDLDAAETAYQEAIVVARAAGAARAHALAVIGLGVRAHFSHDLDAAEAHYHEALVLARASAEERCIGMALGNLGLVAIDRGDLAAGARLLHDAFAGGRFADDPWGTALGLGNLSAVARRQGDHRRAAEADRERLAINRALQNREQLADCCLVAAEVATWLGQPERAARLLGAGTALLAEVGFGRSPDHQQSVATTTAAARAALGDRDFQAAFEAGRVCPIDDAVDEAETTFAEEQTAGDQSSAPSSPFAADGHGLTQRELEVVRLIAAGRSNQQIADTLIISHRTATTHVRNILTKLDLDSRTAVAAWAIRHGLA